MGAPIRSLVLLSAFFSLTLGKPVAIAAPAAGARRILASASLGTGHAAAVVQSGSTAGTTTGTGMLTDVSQTAPAATTTAADTSSVQSSTASGTSITPAAASNSSYASGPSTAPATSSIDSSSLSNATTPFGTNSNMSELVNPNNFSCDSIPSFNGTELWKMIGGNTVMQTYDTMFFQDALNCKECFGLTKSECTSTRPECDKGIRTLASPDNNPNNSRWDEGVTRFARIDGQFSINCEIGSLQCSTAQDCDSTDGPGPWAIWQQVVNLHDVFENINNAITGARISADEQMTKFTNAFAPVPSIEGTALLNTVMGGVSSGVLGAIPEFGGLLAGTSGGTVEGVIMTELFMKQPGLSDTSSILGNFANTTIEYYTSLSSSLFQTGQYIWQSSDGKSKLLKTMSDSLINGTYMVESQSNATFLANMIPKYERILLQPTVLFTWTNLQNDGLGHFPFIAFDNKPCAEVDPSDSNGLEQLLLYDVFHPFNGLSKFDVNITMNGTCYYLLDAKQTTIPDTLQLGGSKSQVCGNFPLPAGTNKEMSENGQYFTGISLRDFIVPAVLGWLDNHKDNDYPTAASNNQIVPDPQTAAAVNIPVCDFLGNKSYPGGNCPLLDLRPTGRPAACQLTNFKPIANTPADFKPGNCSVHFSQWQKNEGDENLLNSYQIEVDMFDEEGHLIGQAAKQDNAQPIEIFESVLPFHLIVGSVGNDSDPVSFWYSDQFWQSNDTKRCQTREKDYVWHKGMRQGHCNWTCEAFAGANPSIPVSATQSVRLPSPAIKAVGDTTQFLNTWTEAKTFAAPTSTRNTAAAAGPPKPTYSTGWCTFHLTQYQRHEGEENPTANYEIEVTVYDASKPPKIVGNSNQVEAPTNKSVTVHGLDQPLNFTTLGKDTDPIVVTFGNQGFNTSNWPQNFCKTGSKNHGWYKGKREFDCGFGCT